MTNGYFMVELITDKPHPARTEKRLNNIFIRAYGKFADFVNPMYSIWNKEYDDMGGPKDGFSDESVYNKFIVEKYQPIFRNIENKWPSYIKEVFAGEDCDFRIRWHDNSITRMQIKSDFHA